MKTRILALLAIPAFALSACTVTVSDPDTTPEITVDRQTDAEDAAAGDFLTWLDAVLAGNVDHACQYQSETGTISVNVQQNRPENGSCADTIEGLMGKAKAYRLNADDVVARAEVSESEDTAVVTIEESVTPLVFTMEHNGEHWTVDPAGFYIN
ncbi:hypothetical protein [Aeromicrobium sp. 179-A 4D2 NHS]|uniref:hypothetical protein n=1 Tax=Aeromicrobium sp. 179-A 4D2 NHS TaxID=3142375 RepID=UPI0039A353BC